jgi:glutaredoxin 3
MFELYGTASCPFTQEMRDWLDWRRADYVEYDVETDADARRRLAAVTSQRAVPVLVSAGKVVEVGWHGRTCPIGEPCDR